MRALIRRHSGDFADTARDDEPESVTTVGPLTTVYTTNEVRVGKTSVKLTPKEFELLNHLLLYAGEVFSSQELLQQVWHYPPDCIKTGLVRWYIKCIRKKIEPIPNHPIYLRTVPHRGYVIGPFDPDPA